MRSCIDFLCQCSRAYIRALAQDEELPVPSPTYLLQNTYDETEGTPYCLPHKRYSAPLHCCMYAPCVLPYTLWQPP